MKKKHKKLLESTWVICQALITLNKPNCIQYHFIHSCRFHLQTILFSSLQIVSSRLHLFSPASICQEGHYPINKKSMQSMFMLELSHQNHKSLWLFDAVNLKIEDFTVRREEENREARV